MTVNRTELRRGCFVLHVRRDMVEQFREAHRNVWPEYLEALTAAGFEHYSSFISDDGLFAGYLEARDPEAALAQLSTTDVDQRWQVEMQPYWEAPAAPGAEAAKTLLHEAFDLDEALQVSQLR
jgi:L-rhamnose mutarotase